MFQFQSLALWNFNAPVETREFQITNCSSVELDVGCTNVGRLIQKLHIKHVGILNFTNILYKDRNQLPEHITFENIGLIPEIPTKIFKQMKNPIATSYTCSINTGAIAVNYVKFSYVNIGTISTGAFQNLTDVKNFTWDNVNIDKVEPLGIQVQMENYNTFNITNCLLKNVQYKAFDIKSTKINLVDSDIEEIFPNGFQVTSLEFDFLNNTVHKLHSFGFTILSQNVSFLNNVFVSLKTSALQGIGPGLLQNVFLNFGQLHFTYNFKNNSIYHADIGSLHPDWNAYKNVKSSLNIVFNSLSCECKELAWIVMKDGLGDEFSSLMKFNHHYLDVRNKNMCLDLNTPCQLPIIVVAGRYHLTSGLCNSKISAKDLCAKYNPKNRADYGFGPSARMFLKRWKNHFPVEEQEDEDFEDFEYPSYYEIQPKMDVRKNARSIFNIPSVAIRNVTEKKSKDFDQVFQITTTPGTHVQQIKHETPIEADSNVEINADQEKEDLLQKIEMNDEETRTHITDKQYNEMQNFADRVSLIHTNGKKSVIYFNLYGNLVEVDE